MKYVILIPVYNEEKHIANVITGSMQFAQDVFVVDDGSQDMTYSLAKEAGAHVVRHPRNIGKVAALVSGFSEIFKRNFDAGRVSPFR
jgi:glycosyltransferase involved in cell wall biosynthesis